MRHGSVGNNDRASPISKPRIRSRVSRRRVTFFCFASAIAPALLYLLHNPQGYGECRYCRSKYLSMQSKRKSVNRLKKLNLTPQYY